MSTYDAFFAPQNLFQRVVLFLLMCVVTLFELPFLAGVWIASLGGRK